MPVGYADDGVVRVQRAGDAGGQPRGGQRGSDQCIGADATRASRGAPVYYAAAQTAMDLRTGGYTGGGPEDFLFGAATNVLSNFYNVPLSMGAFATERQRTRLASRCR
ncbi:MAG: trimethylamine methyltransferase family protein [Anaerolineae bacterium]